MPTLYTRKFDLKESLSEQEVIDYWRFSMEELVPAILAVKGVRSMKIWSGSGALRADLISQAELDDAGVYERLLLDSRTRQSNAKAYHSIDMRTATQSFRREITPELVRALSGQK